MRFESILTAITAAPWAIDPPAGRLVADVISRRVSGQVAILADLAAAREIAAERAKRKQAQRPGGVALVPVYGVLTQRAGMLDDVSGLCSTEGVGQMVDQAAADPSIDAIVLDVDSPGGSVFGVGELGAKIAAAAKVKKCIAVANSMAASGAYWIASQASELVITPGGQVGSIGVYMMHVDRSEEMKAAGQSVTFVAAGERKVAGNEFGPLDALGKQEMEEQVQGYYDQFVRAVAAGRRVSLSAVRGGFGKGGMVLAGAAVNEGMADKVATLDDVLGRYGVSLADVAPSAAADRAAVEVRRRRMQLD